MPILAKRPEQFLLPSMTTAEKQEALHSSLMPVVNNSNNRNSLYAGHNPRMAIVQPRMLQQNESQGMFGFRNINTPINANQEVKDVLMSRLRHQIEQKEEFLNRLPNRPVLLEPSQQQLCVVDQNQVAIGRYNLNRLKPDWPELKSDYAKSLDLTRHQQSVSQELSEIQNSRLAIREQFFKDRNTMSYANSNNNAYFSLPTSPYYVQDQQPNSSLFMGSSSSNSVINEGSSANKLETPPRLDDRHLRVMGSSPIPSQGLRIVSERTKQFESGRPLSPDGIDRTSLYKSELSR